jgi:hypothetical protein
MICQRGMLYAVKEYWQLSVFLIPAILGSPMEASPRAAGTVRMGRLP